MREKLAIQIAKEWLDDLLNARVKSHDWGCVVVDG